MTANLHVLRDSNFRDVPATLRRIADEIEAGEFGDVRSAALTLDCPTVECFHIGQGEAGDAHLMFTVAAARMVQAVLRAKGAS